MFTKIFSDCLRLFAIRALVIFSGLFFKKEGNNFFNSKITIIFAYRK